MKYNLTLLHKNRKLQLLLGLVMGIIFGFLLQKGGVTNFDIIINQLLLKNFTVIKIMLSAVITGTIGVNLLVTLKAAKLHPKGGSVGATILGGVIFGAGFALLGYCPGILAGAAGQGALDALIGGFLGILLGSGIYINLYPKLEKKVLHWGEWKHLTFPELFKVNPWIIIIPAVLLFTGVLILIEKAGF